MKLNTKADFEKNPIIVREYTGEKKGETSIFFHNGRKKTLEFFLANGKLEAVYNWIELTKKEESALRGTDKDAENIVGELLEGNFYSEIYRPYSGKYFACIYVTTIKDNVGDELMAALFSSKL